MKLFIGLLLFCGLLALCTFLHKPMFKKYVEADLKDKISPILEKHGIDPNTMSLNGHELTINPETPVIVSQELHDELDDVIGVYIPKVSVIEEAIELKHPFVNVIENKNRNITLQGTVRSPEDKDAIVSAVKSHIEATPNVTYTDNIKISDEYSDIEPIAPLSRLITSHLDLAEEAEIQFSQDSLTLKGIIDEKPKETRILDIASPSAENKTLVNQLEFIPTDSLGFRAERNQREIIATGLLPSAESQEKLIKLLNENANGARVIDNTTLATRPPANYWWGDLPALHIPQIFKESSGPAYLQYQPEDFKASAEYKTESSYNLATASVDSMPEGITNQSTLTYTPPVVAAPTPPPAPVVKAQPEPKPEPVVVERPNEDLANALKLLPVYFKTSSSYISSKENKKINQAAQVILKSKAKDINLTIGGYADNRGNQQSNLALSLERANSVKKRLIALGVNPEQLVTKHFGEDVSEVKKEDLWKARRVEISLTTTP